MFDVCVDLGYVTGCVWVFYFGCCFGVCFGLVDVVYFLTLLMVAIVFG